MAREGTVVVRIFGEIRDLARKLKDGADEVGRFATSSRNVVTSTFSDITTTITSRFGAVGNEAQKAFDRIAAGAAGAGSSMALGVGAGAAAAGAGLVALGIQGIKSFVDLADKVRDFQRTSGASAEEASRLVAVLDDLEIDASTGAASMFRLARNVNDHTEALKANGVQIARNSDGTVDMVATLLNVGDAYKGTADAAKRANIVQDAFGRGGAALIPILEKDRDVLEQMFAEADKHGEVLSQDDLDKAREFELALDDLGDAVGGLERALGQGLIPALTGLANGAASATDRLNALTKPVGGLKNVVRGLVDIAIPGADALFELGNRSKEAGDDAEDAADSTSVFTDELADQRTAAEAAEDALRAYDEMVRDTNDSLIGIPSALDDVDDAFRNLEDNAERSSKAAADAQDRLADAIENANERIRDAEQDVADAREDLNKIASGDRTDARRRLRDAEERLADARREGAEAIADAKEDAAELAPELGDAAESARNTREEMGKVVTAVEKTVTEMIKQKRPASEILSFITSQKTRLEEIGTQIGVNRQDLELYLSVLSTVVQKTQDWITFLEGLDQSPLNKSFGAWGVELNGRRRADDTETGSWGLPPLIQNFYGPTEAAENQRLAVKGLNTFLRRRG